MGNLRLLLGLLAALAVASFGVINMEPVSIDYYKGVLRLPLFYIVLAAFAAGFLVAWLGGLLDRIRFRRQQRALRRQVRDIESELTRAREQSGRLLAASNAPPEEKPREPSSALPSTSGEALRPAHEEGKDGPPA
jgi:uncharacterized integral membrane protein